MATVAELEQQLQRQQEEYLRNVEGFGALPQKISEAYQKAGGAELAGMRGKEAELLKKYVSAGAEQREKYQNIWDPFARERLSQQGVAQQYGTISDIRQELSARAEALGVAQQGAASMYQSGLARQEAGLSFTQDAYQRALEQQRAAEVSARASSRGGGGGGGRTTLTGSVMGDIKANARNYITGYLQSGDWKNKFDTERRFLGELFQAFPEITPKELTDWTYQMRKPYEEQGQANQPKPKAMLGPIVYKKR